MNFAGLRDYLATVWRIAGGRLVVGMGLTVLAGLTEGLSLVILVPLVAIAMPGGSEALGNLPLVGDTLARWSPDLETLLAIFIGLVILPWNLYNSPLVINYFLGGLGAILGPFFGLIMVDYWLIRRQRLNIPDLYSEATDGAYYYSGGFNHRAFYALLPAAFISIAVALIPVFHALSDFSWIVGAVIAAVLHLILTPKQQAYQHVDGEAIARPSQ